MADPLGFNRPAIAGPPVLGAAPEKARQPALRPLEKGEFILGPNNEKMTEFTQTFRVGKDFVVVPSIFMGPEGPVNLSEDPDAILRVVQEFEAVTGKKFPRLKTDKDASAFARKRSDAGGAFSGPLVK
jgi:hypothetical protein